MVVESGEQICITHAHLGFLSYLLIEERSEEEREGKNLSIGSIDFHKSISPFQALCSPTAEITPIHFLTRSSYKINLDQIHSDYFSNLTDN